VVLGDARALAAEELIAKGGHVKRVTVAAAALAVAIVSWARAPATAGPAVELAGDTYILQLGDRVRVERAPVGCRASRLAQHGDRIFLDCRRAGQLPGTYGALVSGHDVLVVRFETANTAKVVFRARHEGAAERCR
jgi:hypothetical protein